MATVSPWARNEVVYEGSLNTTSGGSVTQVGNIKLRLTNGNEEKYEVNDRTITVTTYSVDQNIAIYTDISTLQNYLAKIDTTLRYDIYVDWYTSSGSQTSYQSTKLVFDDDIYTIFDGKVYPSSSYAGGDGFTSYGWPQANTWVKNGDYSNVHPPVLIEGDITSTLTLASNVLAYRIRYVFQVYSQWNYNSSVSAYMSPDMNSFEKILCNWTTLTAPETITGVTINSVSRPTSTQGRVNFTVTTTGVLVGSASYTAYFVNGAGTLAATATGTFTSGGTFNATVNGLGETTSYSVYVRVTHSPTSYDVRTPSLTLYAVNVKLIQARTTGDALNIGTNSTMVSGWLKVGFFLLGMAGAQVNSGLTVNGGLDVTGDTDISGDLRVSSGYLSVGSGVTANTIGSISAGLNTTVEGPYSIAIGQRNYTNGDSVGIIGTSNTDTSSTNTLVVGASNTTNSVRQALIVGSNNTPRTNYAYNSIVVGTYNTPQADNVYVFGTYLTTNGTDQYMTILGKYNSLLTNGGYALVVGNGSSTSTRSNALALDWNGNLKIAGDLQNMSGTSLLPSIPSSATANYVFAAPNGSAGAPSFRALVAADIPSLDAGKITTGSFAAARIPSLDAGKITTGTLTAARLPTFTKAMMAKVYNVQSSLTSTYSVSASSYATVSITYTQTDSHVACTFHRLTTGWLGGAVIAGWDMTATKATIYIANRTTSAGSNKTCTIDVVELKSSTG